MEIHWKALMLGLVAGVIVGGFFGRKATGGYTPGIGAGIHAHVQGGAY